MTGQTISHYRILDKSGEGGMGVVYKAEDTTLRRTVALKFLPPQLAHEEELRARFIREAQAAASLNHPNICTIFEIDIEHGFLAMEFVDGPTVKEKIALRPLPLAEALDVAVQACAGLAAAHEKGIVHRDIKPANLMLTATGQVKIMDFGLAQVSDRSRLTKSTSSIGTPAYMSPEQTQGQPSDRRTDIWSLGAVLHEMLTGRLPFSGENEQALSFGIVHSKPEPVTALRSGLPVELDRIIAKTLAKSADQRYQNVADLAVDLRAVKSAEPNEKGLKRRWLLPFAAGIPVSIAGFYTWRLATPARAFNSIAILPLRSLSPETNDNFLGLGIADALITKIGQPGQLTVRPISTVRKYAKGDYDALEVARQLNTEIVLEGNLQKLGSRIRVSMHLLRTVSGESIWTQTFDVNAGDVFAIQDEIAKQVAGHLRLKLDPEQRIEFEKRSTANTEAFQYYSKALFHLDRRSRPEELQMAIDLFTKAIEVDPNYAPARAQLGYAYAYRAMFWVSDPAIVEMAKAELDQAEKIDPRLAQIHVGRSMLHYTHYGNWNLRDAIREMRMALRLDPNAGHDEMAYYYWHIGLEALAEKHAQAALLAEPKSDSVLNSFVESYYMSQRVDDAAEADRRLRRRGPKALYYLVKEQPDQAAPILEKEYATEQRKTVGWGLRPRLFLLQGKMAEARRDITALEAMTEQSPRLQFYHHATYALAQLYGRMGDSAKALHWLEETVSTGWPQYPMMERDKMLDPVRKDPGVAKFLASLKSIWEENMREFGGE